MHVYQVKNFVAMSIYTTMAPFWSYMYNEQDGYHT